MVLHLKLQFDFPVWDLQHKFPRSSFFFFFHLLGYLVNKDLLLIMIMTKDSWMFITRKLSGPITFSELIVGYAIFMFPSYWCNNSVQPRKIISHFTSILFQSVSVYCQVKSTLLTFTLTIAYYFIRRLYYRVDSLLSFFKKCI